MELTKTDPDGLTLSDLDNLLTDATAVGLSRNAMVTGKLKAEMRLSRSPQVVSLTISGKREADPS